MDNTELKKLCEDFIDPKNVIVKNSNVVGQKIVSLSDCYVALDVDDIKYYHGTKELFEITMQILTKNNQQETRVIQHYLTAEVELDSNVYRIFEVADKNAFKNTLLEKVQPDFPWIYKVGKNNELSLYSVDKDNQDDYADIFTAYEMMKYYAINKL